MPRKKVEQLKRSREKKFQVWLDPDNEHHGFVLKMFEKLETDENEPFSRAEILVRMAYALNEAERLNMPMPESASWMEANIRKLLRSVEGIQNLIKSGNWTSSASQRDRDQLLEINTDMDEMQESIAAKYHSYKYDPAEHDDDDGDWK